MVINPNHVKIVIGILVIIALYFLIFKRKKTLKKLKKDEKIIKKALKKDETFIKKMLTPKFNNNNRTYQRLYK